MGKEDIVCTYNGILLSHKIEWNLSICSHIDGPAGYYFKWNVYGERQILYDFTQMWDMNKQVNK